MCLLPQAARGLTLWSGCPQTCQSLATASCAGTVGMSAMPSSWWLFYIIALLCFAKEMHADLARWFSGQRHSWAGLMTGAQALVSQNGRRENWLSRAAFWTTHSCFVMCAPTLACEYTHKLKMFCPDVSGWCLETLKSKCGWSSLLSFRENKLLRKYKVTTCTFVQTPEN